ncbi:MAG: hypothetical protein AMK73_01140 [Planctomycetes bacterium SM23_32]|nr:MAG: hypothetical protein AMK73_01140 [Planctomycetes bacterium SM23_32]
MTAMESAGGDGLPVRGLHVSVDADGNLDAWERFIREALPREGVNLLVLEVNYAYDYRSYPQVAERDALTREDVMRITSACRDVGIEPVPQMNCLGHQSWRGRSFGLLRAFPEFDERPDIPQDADQDALYCRSYCPLHPQVHEVVFGLMDELAEVFGAEQFHVGMDEVFLIAEDQCPRCAGKDPAELFAGEVSALANHLADRGVTTWMWGDRFINAEQFPTGKWEGSANGTWPAIDAVPTDIVICDWHYERAFETPAFFAEKGFGVVTCPWQKEDVALEELDIMRRLRERSDRALGMLQTTWCGFDAFVRAYNGELDPERRRSRNALGAANCFRTLFAALRGE